MKNRLKATTAAVLLFPLTAHASVPVEQIEAYEVDGGDDPNAPTRYAPVPFNGNPTLLVLPGQLGNAYPNQTFHAVPSTDTTTTSSGHAGAVGSLMYGNGSVGYQYVTDIYCLAADNFLGGTTNAQVNTGNSTSLPGTFDGGAKVVNNSYVGTFVGGVSGGVTLTADTDLDVQRRIDYMIKKADVTFVAGAVSNLGGSAYQDLVWSSYNSLAVSGQQTFSPTGSPGKPHADLFGGGDASFAAAVVSGYAASLYGNAFGPGTTSLTPDALHGPTIRSLLMAGAGKSGYTRQTTNNLDLIHGAGLTNYDNSLSILQAGEKLLPAVTSNTITGTPSANQKGWAYGTFSPGTKDAVLFQSANTITGITASLNWDIDVTHTATTIDTRSQTISNLALNVYPVTFSGGHYTLGTVLSSTGLASSTTGDNVQYLYSTSTLPAGTYAFIITDSSGGSTPAAFSYSLAGSFASQWNANGGASWGTASNWTNSVPNGQAAQVNLLASPGVTTSSTITLDGNRTVGQLTFANANSYTVAQGTVPSGVAGTLTIDDTGNSSGTATPLIAVTAGNHTINAPVALANGVTVNTSAGTGLTVTRAITGTGGLTKTGGGALTLTAANTFGNTTINGGVLTLASTGSITTGTINVNNAATLTFAANPGAGVLATNVAPAVNIKSGGTVTVALPSVHTARQLLTTTGGLTLAGATDAWTGKLDLTSNDLDVPAGNLGTITNQIKAGFNQGTFSGQGITSSAAANNPTHLTTLGVIQNNDGAGHQIYGTSGTLGLFDGQDTPLNDVLVKYTYFGDANLDGQVDGSDYTRIDAAFGTPLTGWINGDFNYDGHIDGSDYTLIDSAFNTQSGSLTTGVSGFAFSTASLGTTTLGTTSAVPEPSSFGLALSFELLFRRRRRVCFSALPTTVVSRIVCR